VIQNTMIENADEHRAVAIARRNRGLHTGKMAAGWDYKRPDPETGSFAYVLASTKAKWSCAAGMAQEAYRRAVFPERYGDETLSDVIAANYAAELAAILETF
jgi:hypothetical protein